jgi:hypothetical protein
MKFPNFRNNVSFFNLIDIVKRGKKKEQRADNARTEMVSKALR